MNEPELTTSELLEMASLDALGLLDAEERKTFERAFRAAPESVKVQVRREQMRLTDQEDLLPDVQPPAGLRERVLAVWRDAVTAIGGAERDVIGRIAPAAWNIRGNVTPLWRAACIGFATATFVLLGVGYAAQKEYHDTMLQVQDSRFANDMSMLGREFLRKVCDPRTEQIHLASVAGAREMATILIDTDAGTADIACIDLPSLPDGKYKLVVLNDEGDPVSEIYAFEHRGGHLFRDLGKANINANTSMAIVASLDSGEQREVFRRASSL